MRRTLQALDPFFQIGVRFLERSYPAVEVRVREPNHRLDFGGGSIELFIEPPFCPLELLPQMKDTFSHHARLLAPRLESHFEMTACFDNLAVKIRPCCVDPLAKISKAAHRLVTQRFEERFQFVICHD